MKNSTIKNNSTFAEGLAGKLMHACFAWMLMTLTITMLKMMMIIMMTITRTGTIATIMSIRAAVVDPWARILALDFRSLRRFKNLGPDSEGLGKG